MNELPQRLALDLLEPLPGNREHDSGMDAKSLGELRESVKAHGILQNLLVRPHPTEKKRYQIVFGTRRYTVARELKLKDAPCVVRELTDAGAIELRIVENLQRAGIHPLEEAREYEKLLELRDAAGAPVHTIDTIAARINKSVAFVYGKLKLLRMPELAQTAMLQGRLDASSALLISRIPDATLAHKATCEILDRYQGKEENALNPEVESMSYRQAKEHVANKYMKRLKGAPFAAADAGLVPAYNASGFMPAPGEERAGGGACEDCPHRTGNMKALFPDLKAEDVCTNPACYAKKVSAANKREAEAFKEKGQTLLKPKQAAAVLNHDGSDLSRTGREQFVKLNEPVPGKRKTWGEVLEKSGVEHEVVVAKAGNKTIPLVPISEALIKAAKDVGVKITPPKTEATEAELQAERDRREARHQLLERVMVTVHEQIAKNIRLAKHSEELRARVGADLLSQGGETVTRKQVKKLDDRELFARLFETNCLFHPITHQGELREDFVELVREFDVDVKALVKEAEKAAKDTATPEAKK